MCNSYVHAQCRLRDQVAIVTHNGYLHSVCVWGGTKASGKSLVRWNTSLFSNSLLFKLSSKFFDLFILGGEHLPHVHVLCSVTELLVQLLWNTREIMRERGEGVGKYGAGMGGEKKKGIATDSYL